MNFAPIMTALGCHLQVTESPALGFVDESKKCGSNLITESEFSYKRTVLHLIISQVIWGEGCLVKREVRLFSAEEVS